MAQREWHTTTSFSTRLDEAINAQRQAVAQQAKNTVADKNWQEQRKKLKAFDTLSERHFSAEDAKEQNVTRKSRMNYARRDNKNET